MKQILFIGRRRAAIEAARRLGFGCSVQDVAPRSEQAAGAFGGSVVESIEAAEIKFGGSPLDAVIAVAEGAVPSAAAIRERLGMAGLGSESALCCHDKLIMKKAVDGAGIPCARWKETTVATTADELIDELGVPVVLKVPVSSGGRGVVICGTRKELGGVLRPGLLAEGFTTGVEMSVETFRGEGRTLFRNCTRYLVPHWASIVPAAVLPAERCAIEELAERVHEALGIGEGMTHMEIFMTPEGPVFSEIAARPPGGHLMELMSRAYDFDAWEAVLRSATGEMPAFPEQAKCFAGAWLLYPEPGVVAKVCGVERAEKIPGVVRVACRAETGRRYDARLGTGQTVGEIVVAAETMGECEAGLRRAHDAIRFEMAEGGEG